MHHINGKSITQCLYELTAYATDGSKTAKGELISSYECDPVTAAAEFALDKREYFIRTGRSQGHDIIAYQIRQSFKPGEVTAEEANRIGYEFAERFLKGKHAFIPKSFSRNMKGRSSSIKRRRKRLMNLV